jgi:hypothetical protein
MKITYINKFNQVKVKFYKIESGLIKRVIDFYREK